MAVKRFMKERAERAALIDEVKDILLDGSPNKISKYRKFGLETANGLLRLLMSLGNTAFHSGDPELTGRFLGALFELAASGVLDENTLMGRIREYGLRRARFEEDVSWSGFRGLRGGSGEAGGCVFRT